MVGCRTVTFAGVALDWRGRLQAGLLDLGPGASVSAEAAAALHCSMDSVKVRFVSRVTLDEEPLDRRHRHVLASISRLDRTTVDGLAVTSGTRTVIELIGRVGLTELGNAYDSACRRHLTAPSVVGQRLTELGRRGRVGVEAYDELMMVAGVQSWLERAFLRILRGTALPTPTMQRTYRRDGTHIARVDFDFAPLPVIVEVGGKRGYLSTAERQRQERRRNELQLLGKVIYFFTTEDVTRDAGYVIRTLSEALGSIAS